MPAPAGREVPAVDSGPTAEPPPDVVRDSCAVLRGILNDDHGGPLHPPGVRMAEAFGEVQASLQRNLEAQKGGLLTGNSRV